MDARDDTRRGRRLIRDALRFPRWRRSGARARPPAGISGEILHLCLDPRSLTAGNKVTLLKGGKEAFPAMMGAIEAARETICLESYIFRSDATGWRFAELLQERARWGVTVVVIYDSIGARGSDARMFSEMRDAGIHLLEYHPIAPWRKGWTWWRRDHRKVLIVDSRVGITGGINICHDHADASAGGGGWRDTDVLVRGPAVRDLERIFLSTWRDEGGEGLNEQAFLRWPEPAGDVVAGILGTREFRRRRVIKRAYLHAVKAAHRSVSITSAYFAPDRGILRALRNAVRRGVTVRIILPAVSDVPPVLYAGRAMYARMLRWGIRIFEWEGLNLHAKTAVVDGAWSTVGSSNMDHMSIARNLELNAVVLDRDFGARMEAMFEEDLALCREVRPEEWRRRPWTEKVLERIFYPLRHWL